MNTQMTLWPILMQLDLQSVWKSIFQYVRVSVCPENVGNWSPSPLDESEPTPRSIQSEPTPRSIQSCFPLLQGPSCRKSTSAFFRSNWVEYDYIPRSDRKKRFFRSDRRLQSYLTRQDRKSADGDFLQLGPWRSGK